MDLKFLKFSFNLIVAIISLTVFSTSVSASSGGISGYSGQTVGTNCSACHDATAGGFPPVATITGPLSVDPGTTNTYSIRVDVGEFIGGGLDVSAEAGTLAVSPGTATQLLNGEITHTEPQLTNVGEVTWTFDWTAPATGGNYSLFAGVVGIDGVGGPSGDLGGITSLVVNVAQGNQLPIAVITAPVTETEGVVVTFDGTGSNDPDGTIVSYDWNFDDGNLGAGATATNMFVPGNYNVVLTVMDDKGATNSATHNIQINPAAAPKPPLANPGNGYNAIVGMAVNFDGSGSTDQDGTIVSYEWDFGDTTTGTGVTPTHTYTAAGVYTVSLTVTDNDNLSDTKTTTAEIIALAPPIAAPGGPYTGTVDTPVVFDGTGSSDPDGTIVSYAWNFGDGTTGTGPTPTHTYAAEQLYTVLLTVTDNDGQTVSKATTATISAAAPPPPPPPAPVPPLADPGGPYTGTTGAAVAFDGSGSSDADGQIITYLWNFGDNTTGSGVNASHTYAAPGDYTVSLTVTDNDGLSASASTTAAIAAVLPPPPLPAPPIANPGGPYSGVVGTPVDFDGSASRDPDGTITTYAWDFGDGTSGSGAMLTHVYAAPGDYNVTLIVTDNDGLSSSMVMTVASIVAAPTPPPEPEPTPPPEEELNGAELYAKNCAACHGGNGMGGSSDENVVGATPAEIMEAIAEGEGGMDTLAGLTPAEIQAISDWLRRGLPEPKKEKNRRKKGKAVYSSYCAACHGDNGTGGSAESIIGEGTGDVMDAIKEVPSMQFLADLLNQDDIAAVVRYLNKKPKRGNRDRNRDRDHDDDDDDDKNDRNDH